MSDFEFMFALYGLLIGLSLTVVLSGLARAIEMRLRPGSTVRIGWLTPMLGTFVILDLLSFWQAAWVARDIVAVSGESLLAVTAFACAYFLAASLVFPREIEGGAHLDEHFFRVRRIVIGVMLALLVCQLAYYWIVPSLAIRLNNPMALGLTALLALLMLMAMITRGAWWTRIAMAALIARYVWRYLV
ncbi:MAG: hypothetical protein V4696_04255 [Pseudomonadota bacterium]